MFIIKRDRPLTYPLEKAEAFLDIGTIETKRKTSTILKSGGPGSESGVIVNFLACYPLFVPLRSKRVTAIVNFTNRRRVVVQNDKPLIFSLLRSFPSIAWQKR